MAGREARTMAEGSLRWVVASGTGQAWQTASAPVSGLVGYVRATQYTRAREVATIDERGTPDHHKQTKRNPGEVTFEFLQAVTANYPPTSTTSQGASLPQVNFELKHNVPELGGPTAQYHHFVNCAFVSDQLAEAEDGNKYSHTWRAINIIGPTASGYLATGGQP